MQGRVVASQHSSNVNRLSTLVILLISYVAISVNYSLVYDFFAYKGIAYDFSLSRSIIAILTVLYCLTFLWLSKLEPLLWSVCGFVFLLINIPSFVFYQFNPDVPWQFYVSNLILFHGFSVASFSVPKLKVQKWSVRLTSQFLWVIVPLMLVPFFFSFGFDLNLKVFLLQEIYDVRFEARDKGNFLTSYFYSWLSRVLIPVMVIFGLRKKEYFLVLLGVIVLLYLFLTAARKSVYLSLFLVFFFYFIDGYERKLKFFAMLLISLLSIGMLCSIYGYNELALLITSIVSFRFLFVPAEVSMHYFEFFEGNSMLWSYSFFNPFVSYPYDLTPPHLIGLIYYNFAEMSANTGIIGDGFMNMGLLGVGINTLIFSSSIVLISRTKIDPAYFGVFFIFFTAIQNSSMLTILLTHGLLVFLLVALFFNTSERL